MAWPRTFAVLICTVTVAVLAAIGGLLWRWPDVGVLDTAVAVAVLLPSVVLGLILAVRRPRNRVAPLLCLVGALPLLAGVLGDLVVAVAAAHPGALPVPDVYVALSQGSWMLLYLSPALLMLVFPEGRLLGPRWRWVAAAVLVVPAAFMVLAAMTPEAYPAPFQDVPHVLGVASHPLVVLTYALLPIFMGLLIAGAAAMILRYRRATDPVARAQVRWFALGAILLPVTLLLCWLSYLVFRTPDLVVYGFAATFLAIPVATTIALLRHDLYDVDRAFSAAVAYGLVSTVLLSVFTTAEIIGGLLLGGGSAVPAAVATALSALALAPLRTRLRRRVDRRLYPLRQAVHTGLAQLRDRIAAGLGRPEDLEQTLRDALRDPGLRVVFVRPGQHGLVGTKGCPVAAGAAGEVPVLLGGVGIGALLPDTTSASRELLREAAAASALLVEVIRSRLELAQALREVADSRGRLLHAGYRERRRLERDLHDGAQQRLVSLGMAIRLAQRHLDDTGDGAVDVHGLLDQAVAELGTAVAELRAIAHGLRPSTLDSGLAPALRSLAATVPIAVHLDVCDQPVPDQIATTAYYVASEALANAVKHADAERIEVSVARHDGRLRVRISDDGRGGAQARPGSGLAGLVDRVAAAGGHLAVEDGSPRGTLVEAVLPCAP